MTNNYDIHSMIPHRYPFLLIDKVIEIVPGKEATAIKNVTINEWFFQGHFPGFPIMPGVLIVEALAQTACLAGTSMSGWEGKLGVFAGINSLKFKKQVVPGDVLTLKAKILKFRLGVGKASVIATVDETLSAEGEIQFALVDANAK